MIIKLLSIRILSFLFTLIFVVPSAFSQCPWPIAEFNSNSSTAPTPGNTTMLESCNFTNERARANGVVLGNIYTVNYIASPVGAGGNQVVIYNSAMAVVAFGPNPLTFTAPASGTFFSACFIGATCTTSFAACNACFWSNITPLPPPPNDLPCGAIALVPGATCSYTTYTNLNATASVGVPPPVCAGYLGSDVWFSVVVPSTGNVLIDTQTGVILDGGMAAYTGTCGALTLLECDDDDSPNGAMPSININGATPGTTIFIRMWEVGNNNNGTFGICAQEIDACGTPVTNDYCESPAQLTQGPGNFSSTTSAIYTADMPGNINSTFCGSIENNSWYQFTALSTTEVFNFVNVSNCVTNQGVQAAVYTVTPDAVGCCDILIQVSNCYSPSNTSLGTVTASSLTIGSVYILMVDGFSGDACDFTISNWLATGILPVELSEFYGLALTDRNALRWETSSEIDNDYFSVLRSYDGINFEPIGEVNGIGYSQELNYYQFDDSDVRSGKVYYQLEQVDFNGHREKSEIIALDRTSKQGGLITAYPNPTTGVITTEVNGVDGKNGLISITDLNGTLVQQKIVYTKGIGKHQFDLSDFEPGMYFVRYQDDTSDQTIKLIKQ